MPASLDWEREQRRRERERKAVERDALQDRLARRALEAERRDASIRARADDLSRILIDGLGRRPALDFNRLRAGRPLDLGKLNDPSPPPVWESFIPEDPGVLSRIFGGGVRHENRIKEARIEFQAALDRHAQAEAHRQREVIAARQRHERDQIPIRDRFARLQLGWEGQEKEAVEECLRLMLAGMKLPASFPRDLDVAFDPRTTGVVLKHQMPQRQVVPEERGVTYIKSKDEIRPQPRPVKEVADLYRSIISQVALLSIHDVFQADPRLISVAFNGHLQAIDPRTGQMVNPCLISVSVERVLFDELSLNRVTPDACLRHLNALVSPHPLDLENVKPILDFDAAKYVFVEGVDVASNLDARPVLIDMSPTEFEHLVRQLCEAMGMQSWTTRQSNDDGVDAVVFNPDAMVGGESIVQAKRYKNVIGPQHIRELAGAMEEKKAGRGILITTSWFTNGAWRKSAEHNRISLIDGQRLQYLIKKHLGKDVHMGVVPPSRRRAPEGT